MVSKISEGVKVSVETFYQPEYSNPITSEYMFAYRITIENHNSFPVQLLRRHWYIFDSNAERRATCFTTRQKISICKRLQPPQRNGKNAWLVFYGKQQQ